MQLVRSRLDGCIHHGGAGASELRAEIGGLNFKFLDRVHRRKHDKVRSIQEIDGVGIVVDAIQHVVVLRRTKAVSRKSSGRSIPARIRLRRVHARRKLCQEGEISSVQRKVVDVASIHHLAD